MHAEHYKKGGPAIWHVDDLAHTGEGMVKDRYKSELFLQIALNRVYDTVKELLGENSGVEISVQFTGVIRDLDLSFCRPTPLDEIEQRL